MTSKVRVSGKLGYREYCCFPDDGQRHEILDGVHVVNPAPSTYHQTLSRRIQFQLYSQIELNDRGQVFNAPADLQLSDIDIVQPDLIVVLNSKKAIVTPTKIKGTPDLVVDILSELSMENDRVVKRELYRRSAIPEYWIVDPDDHVVEQLVLEAGVYTSTGCHAEMITPHMLDNIRVDLSEVW